MQPFLKNIEGALKNAGFKEEKASNSDFKIAFTHTGIFSSATFLIVEVNDKDFNASSVINLIELGRKWCSTNLNSRWISNETGLNLILLHNGQVLSKHIQGKVDYSGFHATICQSITTLNLRNRSVEQEKTWVVIGKVRKALLNLRQVA